jgi:hypothetical protein
MALLAAVNFEDGLVLLEDGRELPITGYYANPFGSPLTSKSELRSDQKVLQARDADVFVVDIPEADAALIVEMSALGFAKPTDIN